MKIRIQIFLVFIFISLFAHGQTITVTNVTPADPYCAGNSITVDYTVGIFGGTSAFTIELGNFGIFPGTILATNTHGTGAQSFTVTLPPNTAAGNYRIRVNRVSPVVNSNNYFLGAVKPPEISVSSATTTWCAGSTQTVNFAVTCGKFNTTNDFTVQLSNAAGSFASPVTIGTVSNVASGSGIISCTVPPTTAIGTAYKIRLVSNSPTVIDTFITPIKITSQEVSIVPRSTTWCAGSTQLVDYAITCGTFSATNDFTVQLSNAAGSFAAPVTIGTVSNIASGNGTISCTIPTTEVGEFYRIRIVSNSPVNTDTLLIPITIVASAKCNCNDSTIIDWQASFGGTSIDELSIIIPTSDGGYLLGGSSFSNAGGNKTRNTFGNFDYWVVKIDMNGIKQWDSIYGGTGLDILKTITSTNDGGYLLGGYSSSPASGTKTRNTINTDDYWIVKINANGTKQWDSIYGGTNVDHLNSIFPTSDGGFLLGGESSSNANSIKTKSSFGGKDYWLVKINSNGTKQWDSIYGGSFDDELISVTSTTDGGYLIGGSSSSPANGNKTRNSFGINDYWLLKINANGTKQWDSIFGGTSFDELKAIAPTSNGGYLLSGNSSSPASGNKTRNSFNLSYDYWIVKIDANGTKQWDSAYGGTSGDILSNFISSADGNYLLSGYSPSLPSGNKTTNSFGNNDYWIVKINDNGTKLSEDIFGGSSDDITTSLIATDDNGYIIGGRSASGINGNKTTANFGSNDYWVAKVAPPLVLSATPRTTTICAGNTLAIDYSITSCRDFKVGNTIKVELSDATGSFTSATLLLTQSTVASIGTLTVTIPTTEIGVFYKIRVSSSSPKDTVIIGNLFTIVAQSKCTCPTDNMIIDWQQSYGGTLSDFSYVNIPTSDGGYILGGTSESGISGNKTTTNFGGTDYWIIKIDANGIKQWEQVFGGTGNDELTSIISTTDGGYLIGGYSLSGTSGNKTTANFGNNDYWIIKIDANGVKQWEKNYGGSNFDELNSIAVVGDGTFILGGTSSSSVSGNKSTSVYISGFEDYWIIKIDADGNKIWEKVYGSNIDDKLKTIKASSDGNFWLCGISRGLPAFDKTTTNYGGQDFWIIKIDKDGTKISDYNYGGSLNETLQCAAIATDGSLILAGNTESSISGNKITGNFGNEDFWVIKIDNSGNIIWDKSYGGTNRELLSSITPTSDNGFYISGTSASGATGNKTTANIGGLGAFDYWITKVDNNGNMIWDKSYGGTISDNLSSLLTTSDNGFIMSGFSYSTISGNKTTTNLGSSDYWLVKVAPPLELSATARTTTICAGNTLAIDYSITSCRDFKAGNSIKVELSDATGSFTSATTLLTQITVAASGTLTVTIPTTAIGEFYKIRVSSSSPNDTVIIGNLFTVVTPSQCNCTNETTTEWQASFGGTSGDNLDIIIPTADGGYLLGGNSSSGSSITKTRNTFGLSDYWVVKIDSNGIKQWDSIYGGTSFESLSKIIPTSDGGYLLGGHSESNANGNKTRNSIGLYDYWIVKIDANGTKQWDSIYGGTSDDMLTSIISTNDGGYLLGGISESNASGNKTRNSFGFDDYWVIKIDANGTRQWDSIFGGAGIDQMQAIISTADGGYLLGGSSSSNISGNKTRNSFGGTDYWLVKIDHNGTKQWDSIYGGNVNDGITAITITNDGGYLLAGASLSGVGGNKTTGVFGSADCWLVKIDANGIKQWDRAYGGTSTDAIVSLTPTNDNGYLLGASSASGISGNKTINSFGIFDDYWVVKIDANGIKINEKVYGGTSADEVTSMVATKDGGYLIAGYSQSGITGNKTTANFGFNDYWIVKVVPTPKITPVSVSRTIICSPDSLKVFFDKGTCGTFKTGNKFYVQLSNSVGSFATPTILDSLISITTPNSIITKTPASLTEAPNYKIRLVSTLPAVISDTVSNIQILTYPNISTLTESCSSGKQFSATVPASSSKQWQLNGSDIASATANSFFPVLFGNYRLRTFNAGCKDTSDVYSVIPATVASTNTCTITDGLTRFICDNTTGNVIVKIVDAPGGNVLGSTSAKLYIDASVQFYQTQPYVQRHYDITPASSGAANVTLYVPQSEYNAYNTAVASNYPHLPSNPSDALNINNLVITQYHGTSVSHLPGTYSGTTEYLQSPAVVNTWNSSTNMWEINFNVTAFSGIFLHTLQNFALPVELLNFSGKYLENKSVIQLNWQTASELNCAYFEVERMNKNGSFEYVGTVDCNGTTSVLNNYTLDDFNYIIGNNYYRLKQVDEDGKTTYSNIILIMVDDVNSFYFQTISDKNILTISSSDAGTISLYNANGSLIQSIQTNANNTQIISTVQFAKGVYFLRFQNEKNTKTNKIIIK